MLLEQQPSVFQKVISPQAGGAYRLTLTLISDSPNHVLCTPFLSYICAVERTQGLVNAKAPALPGVGEILGRYSTAEPHLYVSLRNPR